MSTRRCPRCTESKPYDQFYVRKTGRYAGYHYGYCKPCSSAYGKAHYRLDDEYRENRKALARQHYADHTEQHRLKQQAWKDKNRIRNQAYGRMYWHAQGKSKRHARQHAA